MKLNSTQLDRTLSQFHAEVVPIGNQVRRMVETSLEAVALCGASLLI